MDDMTWLAEKVGTCSIAGFEHKNGEPSDLRAAARAGIVVEPTDVAHLARQGSYSSDSPDTPDNPGNANRPIIALIGWPTGRHHSLVKAAEARLAIEEGAAEVWLAVDTHADGNSLLADIVAVNQTVESSARLGVVCPADRGVEAANELARTALIAGAEVIAVEAPVQGEFNENCPAAVVEAVASSGLDVAAFGVPGAVEGVVDTLLAGAGRVFVL